MFLELFLTSANLSVDGALSGQREVFNQWKDSSCESVRLICSDFIANTLTAFDKCDYFLMCI